MESDQMQNPAEDLGFDPHSTLSAQADEFDLHETLAEQAQCPPPVWLFHFGKQQIRSRTRGRGLNR
jgi:hypothetical protein